MYSNFLIFVVLVVIEAKVMLWSPNSNFENLNNWLPKRLPCPNDRVIYPKWMNGEIEITKDDISVREIVLPIIGSIKLSTEGIIQLNDKNRALKTCPGEDIYFKNQLKHSWLDIESWSNFDEYIPEGNEAIPHYDRVPCMQDSVIFPPDLSVVVQLPQTIEQVKSIVYENEFLSTNAWENILKEKPLIFQAWPNSNVPAVEIQRTVQDCLKDDICHCHLTDLPDELCVNQIPKCRPIRCLHPIKPVNHCCQICGSVLRVKVDEKFNYKTFKKTVEDAISDYDIENVDYHIGPILENYADQYIQIVIIDREEYDESSVKLGNYILDRINDNAKITNKAIILASGIPWNGPNSMLGGWEAFIMLIIIGLLITGVIVYYYPPAFMTNVNNLFRPYEFARFDNRSREGSLMLGISHLSLNKAFDNPMYRKTDKSYDEEFDDKDGNLTDTEAIDEIDESEHEK